MLQFMAMAKGTKGTAEGDTRGKSRQKKYTDAQMAKNDQLDIAKYLLHLYWKEPFFHRILQAVHINRTRDIPTAGVAIRDARIDLWWNPDFLSELTDNQIIGLLQHEAYHLAYGHCTSKLKPHIVANWAMDLSINTNIPRRDLPPGGWIPGEHFDRPDPADWAEMTQKDKDWFEHIDQLVAGFPKGLAHLQYYALLVEDEQIADMIKKGEELSDLIKQILSMDEHPDGNELSEGDAQVVNGILAEAVAEAVAEAESRGWGSVSKSKQGELIAMVSNEVDWRSILRQFIGRCRRANARSTWSRRNRKVPGMAPGRTRNRTSRIAVFLDESGSMGDKALELLVGEMNVLGSRTEFDVFPFDTRVMPEHMITWRKGMKVSSLPRVMCGGTVFQCCVDFIHSKEMRGVYDGYIILTDGGSSKPTRGRVRRAYVLTPGEKLAFEPDPNDIVVQMKGE